MNKKPSYLSFDSENYPWKANIDYRKHPELYRIGKGEQGVLICEPYKSEIGQYWRFKTPAIAKSSSKKILSLFNLYLKQGDFVGADMARKYLQMGFTRARRYTNYKGGKKYDKNAEFLQLPKGSGDPVKAESAEIFYTAWQKAKTNSRYQKLMQKWKIQYEKNQL